MSEYFATRRAASLAPATLDRSKGTVDVVLSTGADVERGGFTERLLLGRSNVETPASVPLLDSHSQKSIHDSLGRVSDIRFEPSRIVGTLHVTDPTARDRIERGQIPGVSIGNRVLAVSVATDKATGRVTRTVTRWALAEVSLVSVPADPAATMRNQPMPDPTPTVTPPPAVVTPPPAVETRAHANVAIRALAAQHQLGTTWADERIDRGLTVDQVRSEALDAITQRSPIIIPHQRTSQPDRAADMEARSIALAVRMGAAGVKETDASRAYRHHAVLDHARDLLEANGVSTRGMGRDELATRAATTSDFPGLLTSTGNRILATPYQAGQSPLKSWFKDRTLNDFRPGSTLRLSDMPRLVEVPESGEITYGARGESIVGLQLKTYARIFALSRNAIINDDLGAFADWSTAFAAAAAETENDLRIGLLRQNNGLGPNQSDGKPLFDTSHGNMGTAAALSIASLSAARMALRTQTGLDGKTYINATPKFLTVGPLLETLAEQLLAQLAATETDQVNPFSGRLTLLVEPRFGAASKAWYVTADPAAVPTFQEAYLAGAPGPQMASRDGWDVLGTEFRCVLDYGCGALDWRGVYRNPGA